MDGIDTMNAVRIHLAPYVEAAQTAQCTSNIQTREDNLIATINEVFAERVRLSEKRMKEYTDDINENNTKSARVSDLRQELRANGQKDIDWSSNEKMKKFIDDCRALGVKVPDGYCFTKEQVQEIILNSEEVSNSLASSNKTKNLGFTWIQDMYQVDFTTWSEMLKKIAEIALAIARNTGG